MGVVFDGGVASPDLSDPVAVYALLFVADGLKVDRRLPQVRIAYDAAVLVKGLLRHVDGIVGRGPDHLAILIEELEGELTGPYGLAGQGLVGRDVGIYVSGVGVVRGDGDSFRAEDRSGSVVDPGQGPACGKIGLGYLVARPSGKLREDYGLSGLAEDGIFAARRLGLLPFVQTEPLGIEPDLFAVPSDGVDALAVAVGGAAAVRFCIPADEDGVLFGKAVHGKLGRDAAGHGLVCHGPLSAVGIEGQLVLGPVVVPAHGDAALDDGDLGALVLEDAGGRGPCQHPELLGSDEALVFLFLGEHRRAKIEGAQVVGIHEDVA